MMRAAEQSGLPPEVAREAVLQTVMGASRMLRTGDSPESLIAELAVPEGSTRAGLDVLGRAGLEDLFVEAITSGRVRAEARTTESEQNFQRWLGH
jgi:pyrroline-5-carboxylate reductase